MSLLSVHELTEMLRTESLGLTTRTGPEFAIHTLTEMPRAGPLGWTVARTAHQFAVHTLMKMPRALDRVLSTSSCLRRITEMGLGLELSWSSSVRPSSVFNFENPGMVVNVCNPSSKGGSRRDQEFKSSLDT